MRENRTKATLAAGGWSAGVIVPVAAPALVEVCALAGFDHVLIDAEHGNVDVAACEELVRAAEAAGITPLVRVPVNASEQILRHLDTGAQGVVVPQVTTREDAERAVLDYGQCIRDLAVTNIFAGDLLLKNFGVTRHGRVIFYDYDELCAVTDCRFRDVPEAQNEEDEMRAEAWFHVNDNDVFPETFIQFLGFDAHLKAVFLHVHGEILTADWWRGIQQRLREGDVLEVLPYHRHRVRVLSSA